MDATGVAAEPRNKSRTVLMASMIGTTIEFFDFYIYATAAVIVFPHLFFPAADPTSALLSSLATFAIAFFARPIGAAVFGHYGDKIGRKTTLIAALLLMGISTVAIGFLPTYSQIGVMAPLLLALCRLGQGLGLGGEWGGAVLLATENAPKGKRSWYGMFPQLGAPVGFILATASFLILAETMSEEAFFVWGWRVPFIASALLVALGLFIRLNITETPDFKKAIEDKTRVPVPFSVVLREHKLRLLFGTLAALGTFVLFYLMTVFTLGYGTGTLGYPREQFLLLQMVGVVAFGLFIPPAALLADKYGMKITMMLITAAIGLFGFCIQPLLAGGTVGVMAYLVIGFALMGMTYGPLGAALAQPFPTAVRYTGSSLTFNLGGVFGASLAPMVATWLAKNYGIAYVGYYLIAAAIITLIGFAFMRSAKDAEG
ncbi:MFS transporter [Limoniibacter endophyticus]|nr:MFS transporter [Limoniibacter endophyticus]